MLALILAAAVASAAAPPGPQDEQSIQATEQQMQAGTLTSAALVRRQLQRIQAIDRTGPAIHSLIRTDPAALKDAARLDAERKAGHLRGPLHGVTVAVKDLIDVQGLPTTAGSLALLDNVAAKDAPAVARLRAAGAVILAKANTAEWANARSRQPLISWSAVGGFTHNPYALDRVTSGSSSGSGASVAAGLVTAAIGTDTDGSVIGPSNVNGVVGMRPTVGLIPRTGVVPFSFRQDTIGPMGRHVADVALLLTVMAGADPGDPLSAEADAHKTDYTAALKPGALKGVRLGVIRYGISGLPGVQAAYEASLKALRDQGAILVDIAKPPPEPDAVAAAAMAAPPGRGESHATYDHFLSGLPPAVKVRSLADLVAFNRAHADQELPLSGQEILEGALASPAADPTPDSTRRGDARRQFARDQIDGLLRAADVQALVQPTGQPAERLDTVVRGGAVAAGPLTGASLSTGRTLGSAVAQAAYPQLTVPMGFVHHLPVGLSFIGTAWSEDRLLAYGYAFEQATHARRPPTFAPSVESFPDIHENLQPQSALR